MKALSASDGICMLRDGSGLPMPHRRTLASAILAFARSMLTALRHPACAGQQRRLPGHGQPLPDDSGSHKSPERKRWDLYESRIYAVRLDGGRSTSDLRSPSPSAGMADMAGSAGC